MGWSWLDWIVDWHCGWIWIGSLAMWLSMDWISGIGFGLAYWHLAPRRHQRVHITQGTSSAMTGTKAGLPTITTQRAATPRSAARWWWWRCSAPNTTLTVLPTVTAPRCPPCTLNRNSVTQCGQLWDSEHGSYLSQRRLPKLLLPPPPPPPNLSRLRLLLSVPRACSTITLQQPSQLLTKSASQWCPLQRRLSNWTLRSRWECSTDLNFRTGL